MASRCAENYKRWRMSNDHQQYRKVSDEMVWCGTINNGTVCDGREFVWTTFTGVSLRYAGVVFSSYIVPLMVI